MECQPAPADAFRLILHELASSAADTDANPPEPIAQRSAQLDLSRAGAKRLRLEVEENQARMGSKRNAEKFQRAVAVLGASPRFDNEPDSLDSDFPGLVVSQAPVGQGALCPAGVHEIEGTILVAHIEGGGFHDAAVKTRFKSALLASSLQQIVDRSHRGTRAFIRSMRLSRLPHFSTVVAVDFGEQAIREGYLIPTISFLT